MIKFELCQDHFEMPYTRYRREYGTTIAAGHADCTSEPPVAVFDNKDAALEALNQYSGQAYTFTAGGVKYIATDEYYVVENEYDDNGEFVGENAIWAFSDLPETEIADL